MHFTRMDQGSDEDFQILKHVHEQTLADLPDRLMAMVNDRPLTRPTTSIGAAIACRLPRERCAMAPMRS